jgi:hypothetical protein
MQVLHSAVGDGAGDERFDDGTGIESAIAIWATERNSESGGC